MRLLQTGVKLTAMSVRSDKYILIESRIEGALEDQLKEWQAARVSAGAMARLLAQLTAVDVSSETVRRWLRQAGQTKCQAA